MIPFLDWFLLEAKEQRKIYYHGTGSHLLSKIMSEGLIPNPKKRSWQDDPDSSFDNQSRSSLDGIYVTTNLMTALASAFRTANKNKSNRLIVIMDLHPYSLLGDEDDFSTNSNISIPGLLTTEYSLSNVYFPWKILGTPRLVQIKKNEQYGEMQLDQFREYVNAIKNEFVDSFIKKLSYKIKQDETHPDLVKRVKQLAYDQGFELAIKRKMAYVNDYDYSRFAYNYWKGELPTELQKPNKQEAELNWSKFLDQITRTLKSITHSKHNENRFNPTARINNPVGFTGKDKIVCIFEILPHTINMNRNHTPVTIHYGVPPKEFISEWEKQQGDWRPTN